MFYYGVKTSDLESISHALKYLHGRMIFGPFERIFHEVTLWRGHRAAIFLILTKQIFLHFCPHRDWFHNRYINKIGKKKWGSIFCGVVRNKLSTSDIWFKTLFNMLVNRGGGVNSLGCRGIVVRTKANSCHRGYGGCVGEERMNGAVDEKLFGIGRSTERIILGLVSLVGCTFNELHGINRYGTKHNFGDYCWYRGSI